MIPGLTGGVCAVVRKDLLTGAGVHVSEALGGADPDDNSDYSAIDESGRFVAFRSSANNLVPGDTNTLTDLFLRDCASRRARAMPPTSPR